MGGRGLGEQEDAARHQLRKDTKKLRYAAEFFASLFEGKRQKRRYGRFLETLEALQDKLGLLNDAVSAPELLARFGLDKDPEAMSLLAPAEDKESLVEAAADAHDAFADAKPFWR
jgi:CHAD domain-containing protein